MAVTSYGVNDTLAVKLWAKKLAVEALKATPIAPLIGTSSDSVIHLKTETSKSAGDKVTFGLRMQLQGDGVTEGELQEGNEESLTTYADAVTINELMHAVRVKNKNTIDQKRVPFSLRDEGKSGLKEWWAKRYSVSFFNQVAGNTAQTNTKYTGLQATIAPSTNRKVWCSLDHSSEATLDADDKLKLIHLDYAKELAKTADVPIRPIMIGGEEKYVVYIHPYQTTDLRTDAATAGNWFDIQKAALQGGKQSSNPIYTGALGEYNGIIIREAFDVPSVVANTRRAVFLGAQAVAMAFAEKDDTTSFNWVEDLFDYDRELGISAQTIFGMKKTQFNSEDFGTIVLHSYAAKHTA